MLGRINRWWGVVWGCRSAYARAGKADFAVSKKTVFVDYFVNFG